MLQLQKEEDMNSLFTVYWEIWIVSLTFRPVNFWHQIKSESMLCGNAYKISFEKSSNIFEIRRKSRNSVAIQTFYILIIVSSPEIGMRIGPKNSSLLLLHTWLARHIHIIKNYCVVLCITPCICEQIISR